ncbi:MAG: hypothetical protein J6J06_01160 [Bacteroidaceae bacterium]|nr:hypothetical protein [Bacteroidaceae bacterium]
MWLFVEPLLRISERNAILVWAFPSGSNLGVATFYACGSCPCGANMYACNLDEAIFYACGS